ncbi:MAG TPA: hypothetical protein VM915_11075, partial [Verrucomicrobiae bacterium]|nr:hypothetical protein [Verrucomicrobiae bacterium]
ITPATLAAPGTMPDYELRYWSLCTGAAPSRGAAYDCVFDEQVALRDRRYTIVVSRPADRPQNAREECGVTWLDFGAGEGIEGPHGPGRSTVGVVYMRFMAPEPDWAHAPHRVARPGEERAIMGAAFPWSAYTSREAFEARAC